MYICIIKIKTMSKTEKFLECNKVINDYNDLLYKTNDEDLKIYIRTEINRIENIKLNLKD